MTIPTSKPCVVVTGFGPFRCYSENPSSRIVEDLSKDPTTNELYDLSCQTMVVAYEEVTQVVADIWSGPSKPDLVIHIGVHPTRRTVHIEQCSFGLGYCSYDVKGDVPLHNANPFYTSCETIKSHLDCIDLAKAVYEDLRKPEFLVVKESYDPGSLRRREKKQSSIVKSPTGADERLINDRLLMLVCSPAGKCPEPADAPAAIKTTQRARGNRASLWRSLKDRFSRFWGQNSGRKGSQNMLRQI
ncbi:hypothetical protein L596_009084 [Steinernema carpocapsae]|uniref:Pyroglutamyl-peptidase I n=1 Tax=Steinernema carpocapsae TaxID=34508 RepID=A0A4U5PEC6_STECR|nr:hypothetical protein L596_009084 [Steinernema carpocapsae]